MQKLSGCLFVDNVGDAQEFRKCENSKHLAKLQKVKKKHRGFGKIENLKNIRNLICENTQKKKEPENPKHLATLQNARSTSDFEKKTKMQKFPKFDLRGWEKRPGIQKTKNSETFCDKCFRSGIRILQY